jgi:aspartyl-tRNA(Asn)/glutamyl-tRNA(Gln) amidotransferase subunit B
LQLIYIAQVSDQFVESVRSSIPPLPEEIASRLTRDHGLKPADSRWIANDSAALDVFTEAIGVCKDPQLVASWVINELPHATETLQESWRSVVPVSGQRLGSLLLLLKHGQVAGPQAKKTLRLMCGSHDSPEVLIDSNGWRQRTTDTDAIRAVCAKLIAANPDKVVELEQGRLRLLGFFVGESSKLLGQNCDPKAIASVLRSMIQVPDKERERSKV